MTERLNAARPEDLSRAAQLLRKGQLVAFATETVYGLGANALLDDAVAGIFAAKERPRFNPLIVHVPDLEAAAKLVEMDVHSRKVAEAFWPGPVTLVLPRRKDCPISLLCSAGLDSLALRVPGKASARALLREAGVPIAAPSANRSGRISPTLAQHVHEELEGRIAAILDDGPAQVGLESTVISLTGRKPLLLRHGGLSEEEVAAITGPLSRPEADTPRASPGMLTSHYAPNVAVRLNVTEPDSEDRLLAFGPDVPAGAAEVLNLSPTGDLKEAATRLFAGLRELDAASSGTRIAVMPIPETGLGAAINDRLQRAAADRDQTRNHHASRS